MPDYSADISPADLLPFSQGRHRRAWQLFGAHPGRRDGADGCRFAVWAPGASAVQLLGDFNGWREDVDALEAIGHGVWQGFIAGALPGHHYRLRLRDGQGRWQVRTDPYARAFEPRPGNAARIASAPRHRWRDAAWRRQRADWRKAPMAIYELHLGSWRRETDGSFLDYRRLASELVEHLSGSGFTHVELLPITEHPLDGSWGYQCTGFYAPTSRFGDADGLRAFVDTLHRAGYGVILDWVPGHFPRDEWALARFDGGPLYEHADPRRGETAHWGTLSFDLGRPEVRSFLVSSALYWLEQFHFDGLRVDAVASLLYLDYGREHGEWLPNRHGGKENLEAIDFLRELNEATHAEVPGSFTIAEESTAWPAVTRPTWLGGLGFTMKWNMGWMHDSLAYMGLDPIFRRYHHGQLTFARWYAFDEHFVLPYSHDEVVHGKGTLLARMHGDDWRRFASLRLLFAYQFSWPGKKLLFMGQEWGARSEWDHDRELDWVEAGLPAHAGLRRLLADVSRLYREEPALHAQDFEPEGFEWIDCHDAEQSVLAYLRRGGGRCVAVLLNFTPIPRENYRVGLPLPGVWRERLNSDSAIYGGSGVGNLGEIRALPQTWMGRPASAALRLPPLGALILEGPAE